jgi:hypothetical protein
VITGWKGDAIISSCGTYRYLLQRFWDVGRQAVCFIMLNPSTADAEINDPTIERCMRRAALLGFGQLEVVNLFALRATDPSELHRHSDPIGPENDEILIESAKVCNLVICAWGVHGALGGRAQRVAIKLAECGIKLHALKVSKQGYPCHPLYLPYSLQPVRF